MPPPRLTASTSGKCGTSVDEQRPPACACSRRTRGSAARCRCARAARRWAAWRRRPRADDVIQIAGPDAVLRRRAAGVAGLHVAVAEAGVHPDRDGAAIAGAAQLVHHARGADVGQDAVLQHGGQRVVAKNVGGEHHHGWRRAHREAGAARAQHFVAADGVDPEPGFAHQFQHLPGRVGLHGKPGLQMGRVRQLAQPGQAFAENSGVVEVERRADPVGDGREGIAGKIEVHVHFLCSEKAMPQRDDRARTIYQGAPRPDAGTTRVYTRRHSAVGRPSGLQPERFESRRGGHETFLAGLGGVDGDDGL